MPTRPTTGWAWRRRRQNYFTKPSSERESVAKSLLDPDKVYELAGLLRKRSGVE
ncbi:hypothetical protein HPP92_017727 [Vanilla planifolia]|uniref:Uncharacterized protein n=1 Tax=Vanilla planifolia TaxID=51239 RepID=A0A835ULL8_VANPL|nr:hypothetical protein HPP92_017727 [Vanilla planifolia]